MDLLFGGDRPLSVREIQFTVCNRASTLFSYSPSTLELAVKGLVRHGIYTHYASISVLRHCPASPALPAGLVLTEECVIEGQVSASVSMTVTVSPPPRHPPRCPPAILS